MLKAIKIRLYPNLDQQIEMNKLLGCVRFVYNYCLGLKIEKYNSHEKQSLSVGDLNKEVIILKNQPEFFYVKEAHSKVLQQALINLDAAYKNFFKNKKGFPKFKSKKNNKESCRFPVDAISCVDGNKITLIKKFGAVHFKCSVRDEKYLNKYQSLIKSATLTKTKTKKYYLSVLIEKIDHPMQTSQSDGIIGIDLGIKDFVIDSNGNRYENLKIKTSLKNKKKLIHLNRLLSKKQKGSKNKEKARIKLSVFHEKINNQKKYHLHHVANALLNKNQVIAMEDLNVSGMMKNHNLARSIQELSLHEFKRILQYKAEFQNKNIVEIDRFYPSSKLCNNCKTKNEILTLNDREWTCKTCNTHHDRDINAAINILNEGLRLYNLQQTEKQENEIKIKIGRSTSDYKLVENSNVDDRENCANNFLLKSTYSMKQEGKDVSLASVNKENLT